MATFRIYVYDKGLRKGTREPGIYVKRDRKYVRIRREGGRDTFLFAGKTGGEAIEMRDERQLADPLELPRPSTVLRRARKDQRDGDLARTQRRHLRGSTSAA